MSANKEWLGNSHSVRVMNGDAHNEDRAFADYYTTDPAAVEQFLESAFPSYGGTFIQPYTVWEPACGCGNISEVLRKRFHSVYSTDLYYHGYNYCYDRKIENPQQFYPLDFLKASLIDQYCKLIITNPPYSLADDFILHAMDILPEDGHYICLLNINYLAGIKRQKEIYSKGYLQSVYI